MKKLLKKLNKLIIDSSKLNGMHSIYTKRIENLD